MHSPKGQQAANRHPKPPVKPRARTIPALADRLGQNLKQKAAVHVLEDCDVLDLPRHFTIGSGGVGLFFLGFGV